MRKLRVGVWIDQDYKPEVGGGFGYYSQLISELNNYNFKDAEIVFISKKFSSDWNSNIKHYEIKSSYPKLPFKIRVINKIVKSLNFKENALDFSSSKLEYANLIRQELNKVIDVIYYPTPGCVIDNFPYIYTLWDIGHLSQYAFPEVSMNDLFEKRKKHHDSYPQKALMVFCESETGKKEAIQFLNLSEQRLKVIPIFPSEIISDKIVPEKPHALQDDSFFIHYPAQFWSHKNHYNLIMAFRMVLDTYPNLKLILTGSDKGNKDYILNLIDNHQLSNTIIDLGFIKTEELKWLYLNSMGLVMPSFLGPTNMPLLEAAELNCPVACTDLPGHKEQLETYGYYFDAKDPHDISTTIIQMIEDRKKGIIKIYDSKFNIDNAIKAIAHAFKELRSIRFCWGENDQIF